VPFTVSLELGGGTASMIYSYEIVPEGWEILTDTNNGKIEDNKITWDSMKLSIDYIVVPNPNANPGVYTISGKTQSTHWTGDILESNRGDSIIQLIRKTSGIEHWSLSLH
jgi:hypothetical protein